MAIYDESFALGSSKFCYLQPDLSFQFFGKFGIIYQQLLNRVAALPKFSGIIAEPATTFLNNTHFHAHIDDLTGFGNSFAIDHVKFGLAEGRRHFVFNHFHLYAVTNGLVTIL